MYLVRVGFTLTCAQQLPGLRAVSTSIVEFAAAAKGAGASKVKFLPPEERLQYLRKAEIRVAVFAGVSLLVGYFSLKKAFAVMAAKSPKTMQVAPMSTSVPTMVPRPLVLAGPSGAGKSTLIKKLFADHKDKFGFSVSHTTRKPRPGETHGIEYYFTTREEMVKSIEEGNFLESAEFAGNMYGTSKKAVQDVLSKGQVCILDIDMQGVRNMKKTDLNPVYIFIKPPSLKELEERLKGRRTETEESLTKRLTAAKAELEYAEQPGVFDHVIVNDTVEDAYTKLRETIEKSIGISLK